MKPIILCLLILGQLIVDTACLALPLINQAPSMRSNPVYVKPTETVVSLPIALSFATIKAQAQQLLPEVLHTIDERRNGPCVDLLITQQCLVVDLQGWVKRNGELQIKGRGAQLVFSVPVKTQITAKGVGEYSQHIEQTGQGALTVDLKVDIGVNLNWQPRITITPEYHWDEPFYVEVAGIKISLQSQADAAVSQELKSVAEKLQAQIIEQLDLKQRATQAWLQIQQPRLLHQQQNLWLAVTPEQAFVSYIGVKDQSFNVDAGLAIQTQVGFAQPPTAKALKQLPAISRSPKHQGAQLSMPVLLSYDQLAGQLAWRLADEFNVEELTIFAHKDRTVLAIEFNEPDLAGIIHVVGKPLLDPNKNRIFLTSLSYTQPLKHDFWLPKHQALRDKLLQMLAQVGQYDFDRMLLLGKSMINSEIKSRREGPLEINGRLDDIRVKRLIVAEKGLVLVTDFNGALAATWSGELP